MNRRLLDSSSSGPAVSTVVPVYGVTIEWLGSCLRSVLAAQRPRDTLTVLLDGPQPFEVDDVRAIDPRIEVRFLAERRGMVGAWNTCLDLATRDLVHLMHCDDELEPAFYRCVALTFTDPSVRVAASACAALPRATGLSAGSGAPCAPGSVQMLEGRDAVRFLLSPSKPAAGAVVLRREALPSDRFRFQYPYSSDEELHLRMVRGGTFAYIADPLYRERAHPGQARRATWLRPDFVRRYARSRLDPLEPNDYELHRLAVSETRDRVVSVCMQLVLAGETAGARRNLWALRRTDVALRWDSRVLRALAIATLPGGAVVLRWRESLRPMRYRTR